MHRAIRSLLAKARTHISKGAAWPRASRSLFEALERREMMSVSVLTPLPERAAVQLATLRVPVWETWLRAAPSVASWNSHSRSAGPWLL
jgi:hypothetical protein